MDKYFWQGRRVLVTGHTGFKGSWLSLWLQSMGVETWGYSLPPPTLSLFHVAQVGEGMHSHYGDVRDFDELIHFMRDAKPEIVIHMAAQPLVRYSYKAPVETYATNVLGTVHLLEAVRMIGGVKAVINVTSDKCYENREWFWGYRENDPMGGYDPYSSSKGCAELVTAAYRNSFFNLRNYEQHGVALASARAGNVIGGGDWAEERLIPDILRSIGAGQPVVIRNPQAIRPWQHVLEALFGYLTLAEKLYRYGSEFAEGWNFGPDDKEARSVSWIVERLVSLWGDGASWELDDSRENPHEASYLKLDTSKARSKLGWRSLQTVETALESIVTWQRAYLAHDHMNTVVLRQITEFEAAMQVF